MKNLKRNQRSNITVASVAGSKTGTTGAAQTPPPPGDNKTKEGRAVAAAAEAEALKNNTQQCPETTTEAAGRDECGGAGGGEHHADFGLGAALQQSTGAAWAAATGPLANVDEEIFNTVLRDVRPRWSSSGTP